MNWKDVFIFLFGFISCAILFFCLGSNLEVPLGTGFAVLDGGESSPSDWVAEEDIIILDDRIILKIDDATLSNYADSGSMLPILDRGANGIRIVPESEEDIEVGDIVSFRIGGILVVHRVVEKGEDEEGVYFIVKGDSNLVNDGKIRFDDIEYVTIGIIY